LLRLLSERKFIVINMISRLQLFDVERVIF
jgi:hypothetical protein